MRYYVFYSPSQVLHIALITYNCMYFIFDVNKQRLYFWYFWFFLAMLTDFSCWRIFFKNHEGVYLGEKILEKDYWQRSFLAAMIFLFPFYSKHFYVIITNFFLQNAGKLVVPYALNCILHSTKQTVKFHVKVLLQRFHLSGHSIQES